MEISDVHKNSKVLIDGIPYEVEDMEFMKPGKGRAIYRLKLRNLSDGSTIERTYHSGDRIDEARISTHEMQYLYQEDDHYIFMDTETFEQHFLSGVQLGNKKHFLKQGVVVAIQMMGDKPLGINMPTFVELEVMGSGIGDKKDTFSAQTKAAVLETGYTIAVPTFIKEHDIIKVDTRTGTYVERVSTRK
ncbi:MAG: elongation factor P [Chloroflexi bacterium]|nr:elongation factor P [Chloroflexota bacterium]